MISSPYRWRINPVLFVATYQMRSEYILGQAGVVPTRREEVDKHLRGCTEYDVVGWAASLNGNEVGRRKLFGHYPVL